MTYVVFQDSFNGFQYIPQMDSDNLLEVIESIHNGCVGLLKPSQHFIYFIYKMHETNLPILGTKFDTFKYIKAVAGSKVKNPHTNCHVHYVAL